MDPLKTHHDWLVAVMMATEVPSAPQGSFTAAMIPLALRGVAEVVRNRARRGTFGGPLPVDVVMAKNQFSAVCREQYWRDALAGRWGGRQIERALATWKSLETTLVGPDVVGPDVTHYYSPISMIPKWSAPSWAAAMTEIVVPQINPQYFRWYK